MLAESVACVSDSAIQIGNKLVTEVNMQTNKVAINLFVTSVTYFSLLYYQNKIPRIVSSIPKFRILFLFGNAYHAMLYFKKIKGFLNFLF